MDVTAQNQWGDAPSEIGRGRAERLGYPPALLDRIPAAALESFAGVGFFFDLDVLHSGDSVLDLGCGSGTDMFAAAALVGDHGFVAGLDTSRPELERAARVCREDGFGNVTPLEGRIEAIPLDDESVDAVISNGVISLSPERELALAEAARVLRPGGCLAVAEQTPNLDAIEAAGLVVTDVRQSHTSVSVLARKPD
ncbi:MAG: arsenite methyltransferase [Thermoleophilaceae bacterium]|jgi:ubiquinone/menaquinone biosynthesis C-methylase UbiE|nr:arsenite methyltransferase [Thermoleophilaceae bacterium]